jgi:sialidase-1
MKLGSLCLFLFCVTCWAASSLQKADLFIAGEGGYASYRIPGLVVTKQGTVLAYAEARRTGKSDLDAIDLVLRRSTNHGASWEPMRRLPEAPGPKARNPILVGYKNADPHALTYNNPVAIADRSGAVHLLFCLEYMRCFYSRSGDDGLTWSRPVEITATFTNFPKLNGRTRTVIATGPGHGIQLKSGRLLVPVWLSFGTNSGAHRPSYTATIYSDDAGRTWRAGEIAVPNTPTLINPNETCAVELADGRVLLNSRTESLANRRVTTTSGDGAGGWSAPKFDEALFEPICMGSLVRLSSKPGSDRHRVLFANPASLDRAGQPLAPGRPRDRKNLTVRLSYDECETWPVSKVLEEGPSAYSDLAVASDGAILCLYERGPAGSRASTGRLTLARFGLEWLTDGADALPR